MSTLLLRLEGPLQSWGTDSRFEKRFSSREPSKSGVIGLLCAALGKPREEQAGDGFPSLADLSALRLGVRLDVEGSLHSDYHTAGNLYRDGTGGILAADGHLRKQAVLSVRYYLSGASFLVGLEGAMPLLERIHAALRSPVWQLCLGRKAFVPARPVYLPDGLVKERLEDALQRHWPAQGAGRELYAVVDDTEGGSADVRLDVPHDFFGRRFGPRSVRRVLLQPPATAPAGG